ncbi:hypothetical protein C1Y63_04905 [Corynebacterium sp. 13CS0277]|uniref:hypothetical protein n=1 Tax=Corynebacterium sp. 13CS0277 TaxID=2071994 RepID=UPI000D039558|nr:hypothetical protein [Corynebacterium sp. 13CS0277]PRQ11751.1 hypothetical protein C1Y63_04905 [Corynebacterium sp. 13CS0277]
MTTVNTTPQALIDTLANDLANATREILELRDAIARELDSITAWTEAGEAAATGFDGTAISPDRITQLHYQAARQRELIEILAKAHAPKDLIHTTIKAAADKYAATH